MLRSAVHAVVFVMLMMGVAAAAEKEPSESASPPPLPLMSIEGTGGICITQTAYLINPSTDNGWIGMPSVGFAFAGIGDHDFESVAATITLAKRVEVSFAHERFGLGGWPKDVFRATGLDIGPHTVRMNTASVRALLIEENGWVPAVTVGAHYKHNLDIKRIDKDLMGTCTSLGMDDHRGWEGTLIISKTFTDILPRPFIVSAGIRNTGAAQTGLLGFNSHRDTVVEANAVLFVTDSLLLGAEYRQKPNNLDRLAGLVGHEDDWWTLCAAYIVNDRVTISGGYGNFGNILNADEENVWAIKMKVEF